MNNTRKPQTLTNDVVSGHVYNLFHKKDTTYVEHAKRVIQLVFCIEGSCIYLSHIHTGKYYGKCLHSVSQFTASKVRVSTLQHRTLIDCVTSHKHQSLQCARAMSITLFCSLREFKQVITTAQQTSSITRLTNFKMIVCSKSLSH